MKLKKEELKEIRKRLNLTKNEMAIIMGMSQSNYSKLESKKEKRNIKITKIQTRFIKMIVYLNEKENINIYLMKIKNKKVGKK